MKTKSIQFEMPGAADQFNLTGETGIDGQAEQERRAKIERDRAEAARKQLPFSFDAGQAQPVKVRRRDDPCTHAYKAIIAQAFKAVQRRD